MELVLAVFFLFTGIFTIQFVLGPIAVKLIHKHKKYAPLTSLHENLLPTDVFKMFNKIGNALRAKGFNSVIYLYHEKPTSLINAYYSLYINYESKDTVIIATLKLGKYLNLSSPFIEFCTSYADGVELSTNNHKEPNVFKANPKKVNYKIPKETSVQLLYEIHKKLLRDNPNFTNKVLPEPNKEEFFIYNSLVESLNEQVDYGYLIYDLKNNSYRPTWKGAILMTWKMIWPVRIILKIHDKIKARNLIQSIES